MSPRDITQTLVLVALFIFIAILILTALTGCVTGTRESNIDEGRFTVDADCERQRVKVELHLDRNQDAKSIEAKPKP